MKKSAVFEELCDVDPIFSAVEYELLNTAIRGPLLKESEFLNKNGIWCTWHAVQRNRIKRQKWKTISQKNI